MTLRECKVWCKPPVSEQWCVNTRLEVTLRFCHLQEQDKSSDIEQQPLVTYTYIKCILVSEIVIWIGSSRITSPEMENAENSFKIDVIRHANLPFIQEEMTLWWVSDETARKTGNNAKMGFLSDDHNLKDTIVYVRRREIWYRSTPSVKRQAFMTYVAQISKTFMNKKCHQTCVQGLIKQTNFVSDLKTA